MTKFGWLAAALIPIYVFYGILYYLSFDAVVIAGICMVSAGIVGLSFLLKFKMKECYIASMYLIVLGCSWFIGGIRSPILFWIFPIQYCAVYFNLNPRKQALLCAGLLLIATTLYTLFPMPQEVTGKSLDFAFFMALVGILFSAYLVSEEILQKKIRSEIQTKKLRKTEKDLDSVKAKIIQQEKMATLGMIASGVAHQLGNIVNVVSMANLASRQILKSESPSLTKVAMCQDKITTSVSLAKAIISNMNSFGKENSDFKNNRLYEIVSGAEILTKGKSLERCKVTIEIPEDLVAYCSRSSLIQVFMNLFSNAVDAMNRNKGEIRVYLIESSDKSKIEVAIADNGSGIPEDMQKDLFSPFKTSKSEDEGTGLGLYLAKQEIEQNSGTIRYETGPSGTTFFLELLSGK